MPKLKLKNLVTIVEGEHKGNTGQIQKIIEGQFGKRWFDVMVVVDRKPIMVPYYSPENHDVPAGEVQDGWEDIYKTVRKRESDVVQAGS